MKIFFPLLLLLISGARGEDEWGYGLKDGPNTWTGLCHSGHRQSPVDIDPANYEVVRMPEVSFVNYNKSATLSFTNYGHSVVAEGFENWPNQPYIYGANLNDTYRLIQFHLHWAQNDSDGSEHTVNHIHYPTEIHFVHVKENYTWNQALNHSDGIVVIGVFAAASTSGYGSFEELAKYFPAVKNVNGTVTMNDFNVTSLLPVLQQTFYRYPGSLTTPPCNEAVQWVVFAVPITISLNQLTLLRQIAGVDGTPQNHNDRPVQPFDNRHVLYRDGL